MVLDYLNLNRTLKEQSKKFLVKARTNPHWAQDNLIQFIAYQNEIADSGRNISIYHSKLLSRYKDVCQMNANGVYYIWRQFKRNSLQYLVYL